MWFFFVTCILVVLAVVVGLVRYMAESTVSTVDKLSVGLAWLTALSIVAIVPIDVWTTLTARDASVLPYLWSASYWSTQIFTWLVLPLHQGYVDSGYFTVRARMRSSVRDNLLFYAVVGVVGLVGLVFLLMSGRLDLTNLPAFCIGASNAFGLIAGTFLLGYGLVEVPRSLWRRAEPAGRLVWCAQRVGKLAEKAEDAQGELAMALVAVQSAAAQMTRGDPLKKYMDVIQKTAADQAPLRASDTSGLEDGDVDVDLDIDGLAALRRRLTRAIAHYQRTHGMYSGVVKEAFDLEDVVSSRANPDRVFVSTARRPGVPASPAPTGPLVRAEWAWRCHLRPLLLKVGAVFLAAISAAVVLAEVTISTRRRPDLSMFSVVIHHHAGAGEVPLQLLVLLPLVYVCACSYYSLFRLGSFSFFLLVPRHSDAFSLLLNAALMCRFAAPLCYNFLNLIHVDDDHSKTVFSAKMASMNDIPFFGREFNEFFPIVTLLYVLAIVFNVFTRMMSVCAVFKFDDDEDEDAHSIRGRDLLRQERDALERGEPVGYCLVQQRRSSREDLPGGPMEGGGLLPSATRWGQSLFSRAGGADSHGPAPPPARGSHMGSQARAVASRYQRSGSSSALGGGGAATAAAAAAAGGPAVSGLGGMSAPSSSRWDEPEGGAGSLLTGMGSSMSRLFQRGEGVSVMSDIKDRLRVPWRGGGGGGGRGLARGAGRERGCRDWGRGGGGQQHGPGLDLREPADGFLSRKNPSWCIVVKKPQLVYCSEKTPAGVL